MHPYLAHDIARARQADALRRRAAAELRAHARRRSDDHPPDPSWVRVALARTLVGAASRLAPDATQQQLRSS